MVYTDREARTEVTKNVLPISLNRWPLQPAKYLSEASIIGRKSPVESFEVDSGKPR